MRILHKNFSANRNHLKLQSQKKINIGHLQSWFLIPRYVQIVCFWGLRCLTQEQSCGAVLRPQLKRQSPSLPRTSCSPRWSIPVLPAENSLQVLQYASWLKVLKWRKGHHLFVKTLLTSPVPMIPKRGRSKTGRSEVTLKAENTETCRTIIHRGKFKKSAKNLVKRRNWSQLNSAVKYKEACYHFVHQSQPHICRYTICIITTANIFLVIFFFF